MGGKIDLLHMGWYWEVKEKAVFETMLRVLPSAALWIIGFLPLGSLVEVTVGVPTTSFLDRLEMKCREGSRLECAGSRLRGSELRGEVWAGNRRLGSLT